MIPYFSVTEIVCSFVGTGMTEVGETVFLSQPGLRDRTAAKDNLGQPRKEAGIGPRAWDYRQEGQSPGTSPDQDHLGLAGALVHCPPLPSTR